MNELSIIIPHYNSTDMLLKLLDSIPANKEIQVLVIDDHSKDEERERLEKIKDTTSHENICFLENDPDKKGAGSSRNVGLEKATGKWVLFADSDDYFIDGFYDIVKRYFNSNYDVVFFKPTSIEVDTGNISDRHVRFVERIDDYSNLRDRESELMLRYRIAVPWSKLIKRSVIVENNIVFENVISSNDVMFSTKLGCYIENFDVSDDIIYCVTRSSGSLTTSLKDEVFDTRVEVFVRYYHFLKRHLSEEDFNSLDLTGQGFIYYSIKYGYRKLYNVFRTFRKNNIRIINTKMLNPVWFFKRVAYVNSHHQKTKRFYEKN